jgi:hypothetical protein
VLVQTALHQNSSDPRKAFDFLFHSMDSVVAFGRTAKFDYLTMLGKLGLAGQRQLFLFAGDNYNLPVAQG